MIKLDRLTVTGHSDIQFNQNNLVTCCVGVINKLYTFS